ncbi:polysaccharide export outer membrane protein [Hymenobacter daecheongensis DSM 21074]|uniref:Polysaccharide export outer membrane protein n=1 Tax=Hymenobacter daecheongensis DSM 21074 TaxID=1121955 RepID=A0A1M6DI49_9BACT|nr:polysaccharide biosynthesis/export family protein [Hymenobacter daecheongensis]SHI72936.1 polysaccharide export outer membrane protein [Hymenobacter daecheongensis DSM 21074]
MLQPAFLRLLRLWLLCVPFAVLFSSCASSRYYRQSLMFQTPTGQGVDTMKLRAAVNRTARNYLIQPNDFLQVQVYTNKGERILDPNGELRFGAPGGSAAGGGGGASRVSQSSQGGQGGQQGGQQGSQQGMGANEFLVQSNGRVKLPMVDMVSVSGLSLLQADSVLQIRYSQFYKDVFVSTRITNNRVFVLGAPGGRIVPLMNDNMNLLEVLASVGGLSGGGSGVGGSTVSGGRAYNIRLIRGDLKNPQVQVIDLSTIEGMRRANLQIEPNDIVYVEPINRPFFQALTDAGAVFGLIGGLAGLVTTVYLLKNL